MRPAICGHVAARTPPMVLHGPLRQSSQGGGPSPPQEGDRVMTTGSSTTTDGRVEFLDPDGLPRNPAFSNVAVVSGSVRTIYIGGQDAIDADGKIVGVGDIAAQTKQVLLNLRTALEAAGAGPEHVVKWNIFIVDGQDIAAVEAQDHRKLRRLATTRAARIGTPARRKGNAKPAPRTSATGSDASPSN